MTGHVIIDGNNLLHAMHAHAPLPAVGRETLFRIVDQWARQGEDDVTLVFDGPVPRGGLAKQMTSSRIRVRFSAPLTADDVIVDMVQQARDPGNVRVVTSDKAIRLEARYRRCAHTDSVSFVFEMFPRRGHAKPRSGTAHEKSAGDRQAASQSGVAKQPRRAAPTPEERDDWLDTFGFDKADDGPFDGHEAMEW